MFSQAIPILAFAQLHVEHGQPRSAPYLHSVFSLDNLLMSSANTCNLLGLKGLNKLCKVNFTLRSR